MSQIIQKINYIMTWIPKNTGTCLAYMGKKMSVFFFFFGPDYITFSLYIIVYWGSSIGKLV